VPRRLWARTTSSWAARTSSDQCLAARLVDELRIHLSPLVLGGGTRLFDLVGPGTLVQREVTESPRATQLTYEVVTD
jgi:riboflavin biosynthesis pyrimidine reductase